MYDELLPWEDQVKNNNFFFFFFPKENNFVVVVVLALGHLSGLFGHGQLTYPHCSRANFLGSLTVLSAHS